MYLYIMYLYKGDSMKRPCSKTNIYIYIYIYKLFTHYLKRARLFKFMRSHLSSL